MSDLLPDPPPDTLVLSDLAPSLVDQHKGCVGFDRSFEGNPLELGGGRGVPAPRPPSPRAGDGPPTGGGTFERGLGVKPPSILEYQLDGRYSMFRATVGIDLEGFLEVSPARARGEWVQFLVFGDGRRLYSSEWLQWNSKPVEVAVEIKGVKTLRLQVDCSASRWLSCSTPPSRGRMSSSPSSICRSASRPSWSVRSGHGSTSPTGAS